MNKTKSVKQLIEELNQIVKDEENNGPIGFNVRGYANKALEQMGMEDLE